MYCSSLTLAPDNKLCAFSQLCIGSLKSAVIGIFRIWKLTNTTNQICFFSPTELVYQHTSRTEVCSQIDMNVNKNLIRVLCNCVKIMEELILRKIQFHLWGCYSLEGLFKLISRDQSLLLFAQYSNITQFPRMKAFLK